MPNDPVQTPEWLRQMETILETLNEGVVVVDDRVQVVFANDALLKLTGFNRGEMKGRTVDAVFPAEDIPYLMAQRAEAERYKHHRHEFYVPHKNGEKVPVIYSGRMIQGPDGREYGLVILTDISAQKRVEQQLRESNALLERRRKEIEDDLSLAARVQQSLVPRSLVWSNLAIEAYYSPASTIGGDFGVVLPHGDEVLNLLVCDVSGHGIGSALVANRIYSETLHELKRNTDLAGLLQRLHGFVHDHLHLEGFYFTIAAGRFAQRGRRMTFASAGHPPTMLVSDGIVRLLDSQSSVLGCLPGSALSDSVEEIDLVSGDRLVLYTDGFIEVFNKRDEMLGVGGLEELVRRSAKKALPQMKQAILDGVLAWRHGPLTDDMSLMIVELR